MNILRRTSTRNLLLAATALLVLAIGGGALAVAASGGGATPPAAPLDQALHDAIAAPNVAGITARVRFTNNLIDSSALSQVGGASSALISGATGRLWLTGDGTLRLELQSDAGDTQVLLDQNQLTVYDASSNTLYKATLPQQAQAAGSQPAATPDKVPSLAKIDRLLRHLGRRADISGATPSSVAGEPAYTVSISPKHDGGLLGQAQLAWDAANGVPLRAAIYARGSSSPVLELVATDVSFGPVAASDVTITPPANAKVVDLTPPAGAQPQSGSGSENGGSGAGTGLQLQVAPPQSLVGLPLTTSRAIDWKGTPAHLLVYGKGLGALAVLVQQPAADASPAAQGSQSGAQSDPLSALPSVSIGGATGHELPTALGTILVVEKGGLRYVFAGSVPASAAEAAARQLLS
jgi:outer membrane lipoprotein-sorting protein